MKRQLTDWEKMFAVHIFDKGLVSRVYIFFKSQHIKTTTIFFFLKSTIFFPKLIFPFTGRRVGPPVAKSRVSAWVGHRRYCCMRVTQGESQNSRGWWNVQTKNDKGQGIKAQVEWGWHIAWEGSVGVEDQSLSRWGDHPGGACPAQGNETQKV